MKKYSRIGFIICLFLLALSLSCTLPRAISGGAPAATISSSATEPMATERPELTQSQTVQATNPSVPTTTPTIQPTAIGNIEPYYLQLSNSVEGDKVQLTINSNSYTVVKELFELPINSDSRISTTDMVLSPQRDQVLVRVCKDYEKCDIYILAIHGTAQKKLSDQVLWDKQLPQWYPDGKKLFIWQSQFHDSGGYTIVDLADDSIREQEMWVDDYISLSPDGKHFLYTQDLYLYAADEDGNNPKRLMPERGITEPEWLPDGNGVIFDRWSGGADGATLMIVKLDTLKTIKITEGIPGFYEHFTFSPDHQWVLYDSKKIANSKETALDGLVWIAPVDGSQPPLKLGYCHGEDDFRFSPDGKLVLIYGYSLETGPTGDAKAYAVELNGSNRIELEDSSLFVSSRSYIGISTIAP